MLAIHRAKWLAENRTPADKRVLFTTFTKNLAFDVRDNLSMLCNAETMKKLEVVNLDAWVHAFLRGHSYEHTIIYNRHKDAAAEAWQLALAAKDPSLDLPASFYEEELDQVVLAQGISNRDEYRQARRVGRGVVFGENATLKSPETIHVVLLEQQSDGTLRQATSKYLTSDVINGANSVNIGDFNSDGHADIFLPAHNESPFSAQPSTIYLSNVRGGFDKVLLTDKVMAHETKLFSMNGAPAVISATFSPGDANPLYTFSGGTAQETIPSKLASIFHMSVALGDFGANGSTSIALGDVFNSTPGENFKINIYPFANGDITTTTPVATITPYLSAKYPQYTSIYGTGITHTYRLYSDDFNHDGKTDILAEESMWNTTGTYPTAFQMLQNQGNWLFSDKTDQLASVVSQNSNELDYQTQLIDLDHSGINSYLMAGTPYGSFVNGQLVLAAQHFFCKNFQAIPSGWKSQSFRLR